MTPYEEVVLIQYAEHQCVFDGYPYEWAHSLVEPDGVTPQGPPIKDLIREHASHRCLRCRHPYAKGEHPLEDGQSWSPCGPGCRHGGGQRDLRWRYADHEGGVWSTGSPSLLDLSIPERLGGVIIQARARILTVHHLDEDKANCRWWNLAALCQRCHLRMQRGIVMGRPYHYEHSEWFKPFAAGFYAWKYLDEDLTRDEVAERLDELLGLEYRFKQEALL